MVAGGKDKPPFDDDSYKMIYAYSKGLPRDAVKICDEVLRELYSGKKTQVTAQEVEKIAQELNLKV